MEQKRRKQKRHSHHGGQDVRASLAVNILIKFAAILLTVMLMILMAANAPIISYTGSDHAITQMSVTKYFKTRQPVKYIEGEINQSSGNKVQVEYREGVDKAFNDGLDLHQTIEGQFTVLFLGFDSVTNGSGKLHDVNYIMQFNLNTASLNILQIPRDTFMPDYTSSTTHKFNSIYSWGDSDATPIQRVVTAVQESFGIPIDAYVTTTCDNIVEIVDIVGGVPINMPFTMVFEADKIIYEGEQTLNGEQSEWLLRFRHGYEFGDLGRVQGQRLFMAAAMKKAISMSTLEIMSATNKIYSQELIATDLSLDDIARIGDLASTIDMENVHVFMLPGEAVKIQQFDSYSVHKAAALEIVNEYFRTQQIPLRDDQSTLVEFIQEGSYRSNLFDDTGATLKEVDEGSAGGPKLTDKYNRLYD